MPDFSQYPDGDDLAAYITALQFIDPAVLADRLAAMDLGSKALAAAREWERESDWRPFLAGAEQTRAFDPPCARVLRLDAGLLSITSLYTGVTPTSAGTLLTLDTDYRLQQPNAVDIGEPYTSIRFTGWPGGWGAVCGWGTYAQSIEVTGVWGYCATLPADVWQGIVQYGASLCVPELAVALSGVESLKVLSSEVKFRSGAQGPLAGERVTWEQSFHGLANRFRRMAVA